MFIISQFQSRKNREWVAITSNGQAINWNYSKSSREVKHGQKKLNLIVSQFHFLQKSKVLSIQTLLQNKCKIVGCSQGFFDILNKVNWMLVIRLRSVKGSKHPSFEMTESLNWNLGVELKHVMWDRLFQRATTEEWKSLDKSLTTRDLEKSTFKYISDSSQSL